MMMYHQTVKDYFFSPEHVGIIDLAEPFTVGVKSSQKGQRFIEVYMQCTQEGIIQRMCFKTNGNPYVIASLEWLCRQLEGKAMAGLELNYQQLVKDLAIPLNQYPVALRIEHLYKKLRLLMNKNIEAKS